MDVSGTIVTASITNETVDDLKLKVGDTAYAVIKASDVMVGLDQGHRRHRRLGSRGGPRWPVRHGRRRAVTTK